MRPAKGWHTKGRGIRHARTKIPRLKQKASWDHGTLKSEDSGTHEDECWEVVSTSYNEGTLSWGFALCQGCQRNSLGRDNHQTSLLS